MAGDVVLGGGGGALNGVSVLDKWRVAGGDILRDDAGLPMYREVISANESGVRHLGIPAKSKKEYYRKYADFAKWANEQRLALPTEDMLTAYIHNVLRGQHKKVCNI